jgi:hypothetical protein
MRGMILACAAAFGLIAAPAGSAQAAPAVPQGLAAEAPAILLVRGGCGPGWHPVWWRGPYGRMHRRCVPNR